MNIWAIVAKKAKAAKFSRVILVFIAAQSLLTLPIGIWLIRDEPGVFYARIHNGPEFELFDSAWTEIINIDGDHNGFISHINIQQGVSLPVVYDYFSEDDEKRYGVIIGAPNEYEWDGWTPNYSYLFIITSEYIYYYDNNSALTVNSQFVPVWVLEDADYLELFNHLALYNRYFTSIFAPVFAIIFSIVFISQLLMYGVMVWLFGYAQKLSGNMTVSDRFKTCAFASVPAGLIGFFTGIFLPVAHIFIAQLVMIYITYKAIKEY